MIKYYNINGVITPAEKAMMHVSDLSLHRGYGIFDYFLVRDNTPIFFDDYLDRFEASAAKMYLDIPISRQALKDRVYELIAANKISNFAIKLLLTGGYSSDGYTPEQPNLMILGYEPPVYPESLIESGFKLMTCEHVRQIADVKTINYVASLIVDRERRAAGATDVLYHKKGLVSESSRSNFFIVKQDNTIVTTDKDILFGVTRKHILALAKDHYKVEVRAVFLDEVFSAKEAFLTSSTKGTFGVTQIDDYKINDGKIGKVTLHLDDLFWGHVQQYISNYTVSN